MIPDRPPDQGAQGLSRTKRLGRRGPDGVAGELDEVAGVAVEGEVVRRETADVGIPSAIDPSVDLDHRATAVRGIQGGAEIRCREGTGLVGADGDVVPPSGQGEGRGRAWRPRLNLARDETWRWLVSEGPVAELPVSPIAPA